MALTNTYGRYNGNTLTGDLGARGTVPNSGFGGVRGVSFPSLTFIVEIDGQKYASSQWLAQQRSNPYKSQSTVAGAGLRIKLNDAIDIPKDNQGQTLEDQETYAEVKVSKNLKSVDDVLQHIAWLVDENTDSLRTVTDYGNWEWKYDTSPGREATTITDPLGNTYPIGITYNGYKSPVAGGFIGKYNADSDYKAIRPGLQFEEGPFDGTKEGLDALQSTGGVKSDTVEVVEDVNTVSDDIIKDVQDSTDNSPIDDFGVFDYNMYMSNMNLTSDNLNPISNGMAGFDSFNAISNPGGLSQVGLDNYLTNYSGSPLGTMFG